MIYLAESLESLVYLLVKVNDPKLCHVDTVPVCDRQTDGYAMAITALWIASNVTRHKTTENIYQNTDKLDTTEPVN